MNHFNYVFGIRPELSNILFTKEIPEKGLMIPTNLCAFILIISHVLLFVPLQ